MSFRKAMKESFQLSIARIFYLALDTNEHQLGNLGEVVNRFLDRLRIGKEALCATLSFADAGSV